MSQSAPTDIDIGRYYLPQAVQRKFHASEARYPLLEGGRGGGEIIGIVRSEVLHRGRIDFVALLPISVFAMSASFSEGLNIFAFIW